MKNFKFLNLTLILSMLMLLAACTSEMGEDVKKAVSSVQRANSLLEEAKKLKDKMEIVDNTSEKLEEKLELVDKDSINLIRSEVEETQKHFIDLSDNETYKRIWDNVTKASQEMTVKLDKQEKDMASLRKDIEEWTPRVNPTVGVRTEKKDNNTDNPDERITINVRDNDNISMLTEVYTGTGILTEAIHYEKDENGNRYEAHKLEYDPTTGVKIKQVERNSSGQITSIQIFDPKTGSLISHELYDNGEKVGTIENKYQLVEGEPIYNVLSVEINGEETKNKSCENDSKCVTTDKNHKNDKKEGQVEAPKSGFFTQSVYFPNELTISNTLKCYDPVTGKRVVEQIIFIDDIKRVKGINPVEYYVSTFNEDCTKLHCQVRHVKLHDFNEINQDTCCDKNNPDCTDAE